MRIRVLAALLAILVLPAALPATPAGAASASASRNVRVCAATAPRGYATCLAIQRLGASGQSSFPTPGGLTPADLRAAYRLPAVSSGAGRGQTIAVVDAFGYADAEADLASYRAQFGLPRCASADGCFRKVDQRGGTSYPAFDLGWSQETALDLDMVSATCPQCSILLVEADSSALINLGRSVQTAVRLGADAVSNSYGGPDVSDTQLGAYFHHPGIAITASAGDDGYEGPSYPSSSRWVTAVGGTSLVRASTTARGWAETAWDGTGSGCSALNAAIPGASAVGTGCTKRAMNDVSAVADPATGVAVFARVGKHRPGWQVYGGTSAAAPIIAGIYGLAANPAAVAPEHVYAHRSALFDVTRGANGTCSPAVWCTARTGWDGPTGLGTPNGIGAF